MPGLRETDVPIFGRRSDRQIERLHHVIAGHELVDHPLHVRRPEDHGRPGVDLAIVAREVEFRSVDGHVAMTKAGHLGKQEPQTECDRSTMLERVAR